MFSPDDLVRHILALCDVGEADTDLAERTVRKVLQTAEQDYPKAFADSGIAGYELTDLADRASVGKEGVYESESDEESESDSGSEEDKRPKKKQKHNPRSKRRSSTGNGL